MQGKIFDNFQASKQRCGCCCLRQRQVSSPWAAAAPPQKSKMIKTTTTHSFQDLKIQTNDRSTERKSLNLPKWQWGVALIDVPKKMGWNQGDTEKKRGKIKFLSAHNPAVDWKSFSQNRKLFSEQKAQEFGYLQPVLVSVADSWRESLFLIGPSEDGPLDFCTGPQIQELRHYLTAPKDFNSISRKYEGLSSNSCIKALYCVNKTKKARLESSN